ncbi:hypothetical protein C2S52_009552 [Perilla frutescens var. hirtella]|nr:hypothetical protein C2S52_009552 [Perilla frutescens var. hirtella]
MPHHFLDGESQVTHFIQCPNPPMLRWLQRDGGFLTNLTLLANRMGRLISKGYTLKVLPPNDGPTERAQITYYHLIPEY